MKKILSILLVLIIPVAIINAIPHKQKFQIHYGEISSTKELTVTLSYSHKREALLQFSKKNGKVNRRMTHRIKEIQSSDNSIVSPSGKHHNGIYINMLHECEKCTLTLIMKDGSKIKVKALVRPVYGNEGWRPQGLLADLLTWFLLISLAVGFFSIPVVRII